MTELLPCPFCGGEGELYADYSSERDEYRWQVWHVCDKGPDGESAGYGEAYHTSIDTPWFKNREKAIEAWNTRAWTVAATLGSERTCHEVMVDKFFRGCSECGYMWEYMYGIGKRERPNHCPNCGRRVVSDGTSK